MIRASRMGPVATVTFQPFSEAALKTVKTISPRRWDPERRCWEIASKSIEALAGKLYAAGEGVVIDGQAYDPIRTAANTNCLVDFFVALPPRLRPGVFGSLVFHLGPDNGDPALFSQLCSAFDLVDGPDRAAEKARQKAGAKRVEEILKRTESRPAPRRRVRRVPT
jgi:hypothetical protein